MSIENLRKRGDTSRLAWRVRWREADGRQRSRSFETKAEAVAFDRRRHIEPEEMTSDVLVSELAAKWLATKANLRFKSVEACANSARHVVAEFGDYPAASIRPSDVSVWLGQMKGSASLRRQAFQALRSMLQLAVDDELLPKNVTNRIDAPVAARRDPVFMTAADLLALASAAGARDGLMILTMGVTGLRIGEAAGLQVGDYDPVRQRLRVRRTVGKGRVGGPKTHQARDVPVRGGRVAAMLANLCEGRGREEWLFTSPRGARIDPDNWRRNAFDPAARAIGRDEMHPHELRHAAASLAIAAGADVKAVQKMLGHASAAMTTDLYGHLWDEGLDAVAVRLGALLDAADTPGGLRVTGTHQVALTEGAEPENVYRDHPSLTQVEA